ncbi:hypothetical protein C8J57DRAFT_1251912 [Mycena rebaudengoi]|nr:hypothetical protein C8J57DRAFT_1251912 [Mycena rebaudengoi]
MEEVYIWMTQTIAMQAFPSWQVDRREQVGVGLREVRCKILRIDFPEMAYRRCHESHVPGVYPSASIRGLEQLIGKPAEKDVNLLFNFFQLLNVKSTCIYVIYPALETSVADTGNH